LFFVLRDADSAVANVNISCHTNTAAGSEAVAYGGIKIRIIPKPAEENVRVIVEEYIGTNFHS